MKSRIVNAGKSIFLSKLSIPAQALMASLALFLFAGSASAGPSVYVVGTGPKGPEFGTVDLASGRFHHIADTQFANNPVSLSNLVWWHGSLLSLAASDPIPGYLVKINPENGEITPIGPTGLGYNAFDLAEVKGKLYLTDFSNNIYSVDPQSGNATLIAATGMPPDPNTPFTLNADGTFNLCDESFYGVGGKLYGTFDSFNVLPTTLEVDKYAADATVSPALYQIDPSTGAATAVGPTHLFIGATAEVNGTFYGFKGIITGFPGGAPAAFSELVTLDLATGAVTFVRVVDVSAGVIFGAAPAMQWSPLGASRPVSMGLGIDGK
jgi:hypothetical protein